MLETLADAVELQQALYEVLPLLHAAVRAISKLEAARRVDGCDKLTGLADQAGLYAAHNRMALQYPETPLIVLAADVDHLTQLNSTRSRLAGDAVVQEFALVLRELLRPEDVIAKMGGGLFVAILPGHVSLTRAMLVGERVRKAIEDNPWHQFCGDMRITASIGVASCTPGESLDEALMRAGIAVLECKRNGRNQVRSVR